MSFHARLAIGLIVMLLVGANVGFVIGYISGLSVGRREGFFNLISRSMKWSHSKEAKNVVSDSVV